MPVLAVGSYIEPGHEKQSVSLNTDQLFIAENTIFF